MLPSTSTFSMSNAALHNHGISGSGPLHNTAATPTGPSNPESALTPSWRLHRRSSQDARLNSDSLGPGNDGILDAARADHTAVPELEGQSRHEDEDSRPPSTRTCQEPPAPASSKDAMTRTTGLAPPSEFTSAQQLCEYRNLRVSSVSYTHLTLPTNR